ncbi:MAG TPA: hypothetical protein VIF62_12350, partial [Labilithrix sp.]
MSRTGGASAFAIALFALIASACGTAAAPRAASAEAIATPEQSTEADDDADDEEDGDVEVDSEPAQEGAARGPCPAGMALIDDGAKRFCIDKYEASLVEFLPDGTQKPFPHYLPVDGHDVRAVSAPAVFPQGYISEVQAQDACVASSKRLCRPDEWKTACMGPSKTTFPYGDARKPGVCHDQGKSAVVAVFGAKAVALSTPGPAIVEHNQKLAAAKTQTTKKKNKKSSSDASRAQAKKAPTATKTASASRRSHAAKKSARPASVDPGVWAKLNDPNLGQVEGALAKTGDHAQCVNDFGVFDMVG